MSDLFVRNKKTGEVKGIDLVDIHRHRRAGWEQISKDEAVELLASNKAAADKQAAVDALTPESVEKMKKDELIAAAETLDIELDGDEKVDDLRTLVQSALDVAEA